VWCGAVGGDAEKGRVLGERYGIDASVRYGGCEGVGGGGEALAGREGLKLVFDAGGMVEQGSSAVRLGAWWQVVVGYVSLVCFISLYFLIELHGFGRVVLLTQKLVEIWRT